MADVAPESQRTEHVEIELLRDWHRQLHIGPLLIVGSIDKLRLHTRCKQQ
jgi:hypothetical protein